MIERCIDSFGIHLFLVNKYNSRFVKKIYFSKTLYFIQKEKQYIYNNSNNQFGEASEDLAKWFEKYQNNYLWIFSNEKWVQY